MRILVTGAAGSGTSTLARALAEACGAVALEADDLLWLPSDPPYRRLRPAEERDALMEAALLGAPRCVVAGSVCGWGVDALLDRVVFLRVPTEVRLGRLRAREARRFGAADPDFLAWAAQYDDGPPQGRSLAGHEAWLRSLRCPVVRLEGEMSVDEQVGRVLALTSPELPFATAELDPAAVRGARLTYPRDVFEPHGSADGAG